jgi:transcriptional regulator with XRE-family HTH domain
MDDLAPSTSDVTMPESFGARVRRHREARDISLKTISDQTKIKLSLLEGLERDDISHWPAGIFRKAYVRAYALAIGLDPDGIVREFLLAHPEPVAVIETTPAPPPRLRGLVGSAMDSLSRLRRLPPVIEEPRVRESLTPPEFGRRAEPQAQPQGTAGYAPLTFAAPPPIAAPPDVPIEPTVDTPLDVDFIAASQLCTELGRVDDGAQLEALLPDVARIVDAVGLIVWIWDPIAVELRPAFVHGYSEKVLAQLPPVKRDDDNITAAAFRAGRTCAIAGSEGATDALVVPLLRSSGATGALAFELPCGRAQAPAVRAAATVFAAMLAQLVGGAAAVASEDVQPPAASAQFG